ncbi:MAG: hypothetical protein ACRC2T_13230, partial [Thermoguttaceae bacterium]
INDSWAAKLGFEPGESLTLKNPAAQGEARLRTTLLPNLFALVPKNRPIRDKFRLFELGHVYFPEKPGSQDGNSEGCKEVARLAGVSFQQSGTTIEEHYLAVKSAVEDIGTVLCGSDFRFVAPDTSDFSQPWRTAGHYVEVCLQDGTCVGTLGVIEKGLLAKISPEGGQVVWFELELDKIPGNLFPVIKYTELPRFPGSWQDFSIIWNIDRGFTELEKLLDTFTHPLINRREFLVVYKGKGLEKGTGSYSFRYWIGAENHTLTGDEIDAFHKSFLEFLAKNQISIRG